MTLIEWLESGDIVIKYFVKKYLFEEPFSHNNDGYIRKYLDLYNVEKKIWGENIYSGKWTSSHYTLLEL